MPTGDVKPALPFHVGLKTCYTRAMYDFETASAMLRDIERDRRHFRVKVAKRAEQTTTRFAQLRKRGRAVWPALSAIVSRFSARL